MRKIIALALVFIVFTVTATAQEFRAGLRQPISTEDTIKSLQDHGRVRFSLSSTVHAFEKICNVEGISNLDLYNKMQGICDVVIRSNVCKDVKKEDLLRCEIIDKESQVDLWEFLKGCAQGVLDSIKEILKFLWDVLKWVGGHLTSSDAWVKTGDNVSEYSNMAKSYLHSEYEKAYAKSSSSLESVRKIKAAMKMSTTISEMIVSSISSMISNKYKEFGCLNFEAKSNAVCTFIGYVAIPPAGLLALIKYGPVIAAKKFPNIKKAFSNIEKPESKKSNTAITAAEKKELEKKIEEKIEELTEIHRQGKLMVWPYRRLASSPTVEVVGTITVSKKLGQRVAQDIKDFDSSMTKLGFIKPKSTRIVLSDKPILSSTHGPRSITSRIFNIWSGFSDSTIHMKPHYGERILVKSKSTLLHERTHSILKRTYSWRAFVNYNETVNEALADFFSAHKLGNPKIGKIIRDIEHRFFYFNNKKSGERNSLDDFVAGEFHNNSMFMSNALWEVRKQLGPEATSKILKLFLDNLNQYRSSFYNMSNVKKMIMLRKIPGKTKTKSRKNFINELQYFLAILKRTAYGTENAKAVNKVIDKIADDLHIPSSNIDEISKTITKSYKSFDYLEEPWQVERSRKNNFHGAASAAAEAAIIGAGGYYIYQFVMPDEE